jgi:hypothetical protein
MEIELRSGKDTISVGKFRALGGGGGTGQMALRPRRVKS